MIRSLSEMSIGNHRVIEAKMPRPTVAAMEVVGERGAG